jgi:hypothetical protein
MIGTIVTLAGKRPLYVVTGHTSSFYTCTPVIGGKPVVCKRNDIKPQSVEQLLKRYEGLSPRHATASFAHNLPARKKEALRFSQKMYRRGKRTS